MQRIVAKPCFYTASDNLAFFARVLIGWNRFSFSGAKNRTLLRIKPTTLLAQFDQAFLPSRGMVGCFARQIQLKPDYQKVKIRKFILNI
jgi:hypothetical protein